MVSYVRMIAATFGLVIAATGCANSLARFIVEQRNHQGDVAIDHKNPDEAATAYKLALRIDPRNAHARNGLASVQLQLAAAYYTESRFDDALAACGVAAKYEPQSARLAQLRSEIEQARVNQQIVLSNYPTYYATGLELRRAYAALRPESNKIVTTLQRFNYNYDANELLDAIKASALLGAEVTHLTARLKSYRQLVEAGSPDRSAAAPLQPAASLLPLP